MGGIFLSGQQGLGSDDLARGRSLAQRAEHGLSIGSRPLKPQEETYFTDLEQKLAYI